MYACVMRGRERVLAPRRATMLSDASRLFLFPPFALTRCSSLVSFPSIQQFPPYHFSLCRARTRSLSPLVFPIRIVNVALSPVSLGPSLPSTSVSVSLFHPFSRIKRQSKRIVVPIRATEFFQTTARVKKCKRSSPDDPCNILAPVFTESEGKICIRAAEDAPMQRVE